MDLADQLQKLQTLREQGALTEDEFTNAKKRVIDGLPPNAAPNGAPEKPAGTGPLHQLRRSISDRWIGGVCGGLAQMTNIPAWSWRILFVLTLLLNGLGAAMYILLWIFVPLDLPPARVTRETP